MDEKNSTDDDLPFLSRESCGTSGFRGLSKEFKANPTIENYVRLRRESPDEIIEIGISSGIEWLFANEETLRNFNIDPEIVAGTLDADDDAISELSLILLERIIERKNDEKAGGTHLASRGVAISDSLVNFLINMMLDSIEWNDEYLLNRDLIVLIRNQIGGEYTSWDRSQKTHDLRLSAIWLAAQMIIDGKEPSYRNIAKQLGVNVTTVSRWFSDTNLRDEGEKFAKSFSQMRTWASERKEMKDLKR